MKTYENILDGFLFLRIFLKSKYQFKINNNAVEQNTKS